jgi:EAL domain-containing protein (putative c-di-GMP-specific phosphodiesterase class I)
VGGEALLRWRHPEKGLLLPADFIDLAELTGVILELEITEGVAMQNAEITTATLRALRGLGCACALTTSAPATPPWAT